MSEVDIVIGFVIGLIVGAYSAYYEHDLIAGGVALMKMQKIENKRVDAEEAKAKNDAANASNPLFEESKPQHPTQEENH